MEHKYIHPQNRVMPPKGGKCQGDMCDGMKNSGDYPMPKMNRKVVEERDVKGPEHYRKE